MRLFLGSLGAVAAVAASSAAQGTISTQGFGYPAGGVSTRAAAGGSGFAEFDFASPRNPSSLLGWGRGGLYFQYDPEFRSVNAGPRSEKTTTARFPVVAAAIQGGPRTIVTLSSTTLLDRTWATRVRSGQRLGTDSVEYEERVESNGAINDLRLAAAYAVTSALSVGVGIHGFTGENRLRLHRHFDDSLKYGAIDRALTLGYLGNGISVGATWRPVRNLAFATSARGGGTLDMRLADSVVASARVPNRLGFGARFDGLPGASVGFSAERTGWSRMGALSSSTLDVRDGWDVGVGAELIGPRLGALPMLLYLGYRDRDLPFSTTGEAVSERFVAAGTSLPLSGPRAVVDIALQRSSRSSVEGVKESAWILSVGFTVRP